MKNMKHILSGVLVAAMVAASGAFVSADQVTFTDRFNPDGTLHWAWANGYIPYLVEKNVINGYTQDDGTSIFKPEAKVTRAEFIKMLDETFGLTETADISAKYSDVSEANWFYPYFAKAVEQGYILDYGTKANPDGELSREEATSLLVRYLALPDDEKVTSSTFSDYDKIDPRFRDDVLKAAKAEVINGYAEADGSYTYRPKNILTRAEALTILYRAAGAIFTENTSAAETSAFEKNAVIKTGGITLTNQDLKGRVIVGEGADNGTVAFSRSDLNDVLYIRGDANIVFDATTAKTVVVDSDDIINITVLEGSAIEHLIINERTNVMLGAGTCIDKLTTTENAKFTNVSGTGVIKSAEIGSSDFSAAMVPTEYEIAKGLTAVFASKEYKGSSAAQNPFASAPTVSVEGNYQCLNLTATAAGEVRYYYTNSSVCPEADEFDLFYTVASDKDDFTVKANKAESQLTFKYDTVKKYSYMVLQLVADGIDYQPVLVSCEIAEGTGFTKDPYLKSQTKIEFTAKADGTVYYMYSEKDEKMTAEEFLDAYDDQSKELKGESKELTDVITINSRYADVNRYMVFMFKSASGLCYTPVVVPMGDTGFSFDPQIDSDGIIAGTPKVDGFIYVYFSESADLPSTSKFNSFWRDADYNAYEPVREGREITVEIPTNLPTKYTYAIIAIRESGGDYLMPIALKIENDHGFTVLPEISDDEEILLKPSVDGTVYYYYSKSAAVPDADTFNEEYSDTASSYRSKFVVDGGLYETIIYSESKASSYPYLVIMLEDDEENCYHPVVVSLNSDSGTGFITAPYVVDSSTIYFKTDYDCEVWWYYARYDTAVSAEKFSGKWYQALNGGSVSADKNMREIISYDSDIAEDYPYLVIATSKYSNSDVYTTPIILKLGSDEEAKVEGAGIKVVDVKKGELLVNSYAEGTIYYYETNESAIPSKSDFDLEYMATERAYRGYVSAEAGEKNIELSISGLKKYVILQLEGNDKNGRVLYEVVRVNTATGGSDSSDTGSSTTNKYGFELKDIDPRNRKLVILPQYTGKITVKIANLDKSWVLTTNTYDVKKSESLTVEYPNINSSIVGNEDLFIFIELKSDGGITFAEYKIEFIPVD